MRDHDTVHAYNCRDTAGIIALVDFYIRESAFDGWAVLHTYNVPCTLHVFYDAPPSTTTPTPLTVWNGDANSGVVLLNQVTNSIDTTFVIIADHITFRMQCDVLHHNIGGLSVEWNTDNTAYVCGNLVSDTHLDSITNNEAFISWSSDDYSSVVTYGDTSILVSGQNVHLTGLSPVTRYTVYVNSYSSNGMPCCRDSIKFYTKPDACIGCPDPSDLTANYTVCTYGSNRQPYDSIGIIPMGNTWLTGRHVVFSDPTEYDPYTNGHLRTVCPGTMSSVRLGNPQTGCGESVSYRIHIDTTLFSLLLLHYAVVLQNPNDHALNEQPGFKMEIVDQNGDLIDPSCGAADFRAASNLEGWQSVSGSITIYKDWTTVGVNLSAYHGQDVEIRFTSFDCWLGAHYGYAYYTFECRRMEAYATTCANADSNTFTAPDGFEYIWYHEDSNTPFSYNQTVTLSTEDDYIYCRLVSPGKPDCYINMPVYIGHRWPLAIVDTLGTEDRGCDGYYVHFLNLSTVIDDSGAIIDGGVACESALWNFGDGYISSEYSPTHIYFDSGTYDVKLYARIGGGRCTDTTHFFVHVPDQYVYSEKPMDVCDSLLAYDGVWYTTDTVGPPVRIDIPHACDTIYYVDLHILHSKSYEVPVVDTFCYSSVYHWRTFHIGSDTITTVTHYRVTDTLLTAEGCDSSLTINLVQIPRDTASVSFLSDCVAKTYTLTTTTQLPFLTWSSSPHDPTLDGQEHNPVVHVFPTERTNYTLLTDYRDSNYCPTYNGFSLQPVSYPNAQLSVTPEALSYDNLELNAHDLSIRPDQRSWDLIIYPDGSDTLHSSETSNLLIYNLTTNDLDSILVILAVSNSICWDTARVLVPFHKVAIWMPNVFTPGEELNNRFAVSGIGLLEGELSIYNRQGMLVYSTNDLTLGWDGTSNGRPSPQGAYVWMLRYRSSDFPALWQHTHGTVTLLR